MPNALRSLYTSTFGNSADVRAESISKFPRNTVLSARDNNFNSKKSALSPSFPALRNEPLHFAVKKMLYIRTQLLLCLVNLLEVVAQFRRRFRRRAVRPRRNEKQIGFGSQSGGNLFQRLVAYPSFSAFDVRDVRV